MPTIRFIDPQGSSREVTAHAGVSLMRAAVDADLPGIDAQCGGYCSCATCHVYLEEASEKVPPPALDESAVLEFVVAERRPNSRLSCQIELTEAMNGLVVSIPPTQV